MYRKKCYVSFDYDNDRHYKYLLEAWNSNSYFEFVFSDYSPREIQSDDIDRVKAAITARVNQTTHTLVIVGREANKPHKDRARIGHRNWINFEIAQSKRNHNKLVAIKLDRGFESPDELLNSGAEWAMSFTQDAILSALN